MHQNAPFIIITVTALHALISCYLIMTKNYNHKINRNMHLNNRKRLHQYTVLFQSNTKLYG